MQKFEPAKSTQKTYTPLLSKQKVPNDYEIATTDLLYYVKKGGFEVDVPLGDWYRRHQKESQLFCADFDRFQDPRETTYSKYVDIQSKQEAFVTSVLSSATAVEAASSDFERVATPLRYAWHGFQMISAYVGQMAPGGRITVVSALQAADETRRIQRVAYRMAHARENNPAFGDKSRDDWQKGEHWQPFRALVERMLVAYDWGEAFVALNLCAKPLLDDFFMVEWARATASRGDFRLGQVFQSLQGDCEWQRSWAGALTRMLIEEDARNKASIQKWVSIWLPQAKEALRASTRLCGESFTEGSNRVLNRHAQFLKETKVV